ncbi:MAG: hypothetical protein Q8N03_17360 [Ignavibacteria bacterium]|nr:hypothetical protein [Ignavibacteria bacterium]
MSIISAIFGAIVGIAILDIIFSSLTMMVGAKVAGIQNISFGKSLIAAIGASFITWIISLLFSIIPVVGTVLGFIVGLIFSLFVIKGAFSTTFSKALLVWIFNIITKIIAVIIALLTFASEIVSFI